MDGVQKLLIVVVVTLTILLLVIGFQVLLIIIDLRRAIKRLNNILGDSILGGGLIQPDKLTGILEVFRRKKTMETREQGNFQDRSSSSE